MLEEMAMTRFVRVVLAGLFGAALVVASAPAASAHAAYKSSNPGDGATVSAPPSEVTAEFTEPITNSSYLEVYDPCGQRVDNGSSQISGYNMSIGMSADKAGEYTVEFAAQSVDTHITYGSFSFTSSGGAPCPGSEPVDPGPGDDGGSGPGGGGGPTGPDGGGSATGGSGGSGSGGGPAMAAGGGGSAGGRHARHRDGGDPKARGNGGGSKAGGSGDGPVAFENTGDTAPQPAPAAWDLPIGGVLMALVLCVMIGAAGGRVYAGIVAPPRR
jgi:methionine-rich copper-binding protein CopC